MFLYLASAQLSCFTVNERRMLMKMRKSYAVFPALFFSLAIISGCALTDSSIKLKCDIADSTEKVVTIPDVSIKMFVDARKVDDPKFLFYKNNNYGKTNGQYLSEDSSVADFLTSVVRETAQKAGVKIKDDSELVLSGRLLSLESQARVGFWSANVETTLFSEIQLSKGSQMLKKESIIEKSSSSGASVITDRDYQEALEEMFKKFSASVNDFLKSLLTQEADKRDK
jgi:hypothetical protein